MKHCSPRSARFSADSVSCWTSPKPKPMSSHRLTHRLRPSKGRASPWWQRSPHNAWVCHIAENDDFLCCLRADDRLDARTGEVLEAQRKQSLVLVIHGAEV